MIKKIVAVSVILALLAGGTVFLVKGIGEDREHKRGRDIYDEITEDAVFPQESGEIIDASKKGYSGLKIDFEKLYDINPDIKGWLYIPDTQISYPVVQTTDNNKYLGTSFNGERNASGALFLDRDYADEDENMVIYGHHMKDGSMLASLDLYKERDFFNKHLAGFYITPDREYRLDFVSCRLLDGYDEAFLTSFGGAELYQNYIDSFMKKSMVPRTDVTVTTDDNIISIVTCDYSRNNGRLVLIGKKTGLM